jgi:hypothetical protein
MYNESENMVRIKRVDRSIAIHNIGPKTAEFLKALVEASQPAQDDPRRSYFCTCGKTPCECPF